MHIGKHIHRQKIILGAIIICALFVRLYGIDRKPFWWDETCGTIYNAKLFMDTFSLKVCLKTLNSIIYVPLMSVWGKLASFTGLENIEAIWRLPSAIAGVAGIYVIYKVAGELFDRETALLSALLLSFSAFHIWHSQEARGYPFVVLSVLTAAFFLIKWLKNNKAAYFYLVFIFMALSIFLQHLSILAFLSVIPAFMILPRRRFLKKYLLALLVAVGLLAVLLLAGGALQKMVSAKISGWEYFYWVMKPLALSPLFTLENFQSGHNASAWLRLYSDILFFPLICLSLYSAVKMRDKPTFLIACFAFIPPIILWAFSYCIISFYLDKYLISCLPFYLILASRGFSLIRPSLVRKVIAVNILIVLGLSLFYYQKDYMEPFEVKRGSLNYMRHQGVHFLRRPFKETACFIAGNIREGDIIVFTSRILHTLRYYYLNRGENAYFYGGFKGAYPASLITSSFLFYFDEFPLSHAPERKDGKVAIPIYDVMLRKPPWQSVNLSLIAPPKRPLYLLDKELEKINFKRIWILYPFWDGKETDIGSKAIINYLSNNEKLEPEYQKRIGDIGIALFRKP